MIIIGIILFFLLSGFGMYGMMGFGMGWWMIFGFVFWAIIIWLIINAFLPSKSPDELAILKKRYARGEISKKQYEEMRKDLED